MKKILVLTALLFSLWTTAPAQSNVQEMKVLPKAENCCCDPHGEPATMSGQLITGGLTDGYRVNVQVYEIINFTTVDHYVVKLRGGFYRLQLHPCSTYVIQPHVVLPDYSYDIWEPGNALVQNVQSGEYYVQNFVLLEILTYKPNFNSK